MKKLLIISGGIFLALCLHATDIDVTKYGAVGDAKTLNTTVIQKAIDDCSKSGGGKIIFPAGKYLSGTIVLKDNVTMHLKKNALLLGSTNVDDYQNIDPFTDGLGVDVGWALLVAVDATNIGIEGEGAIDGQGAKLKEQQILTDTRPEGQRWGRRPFLLRIVRCTNVSVKDVTLNYSAAWTSHYFQCKVVRIENVKILSRGVPHNDGIDIDGCQDVRIKDCDIVSGDDALCFKTTSSQMACKDIVVTGMRLKSGHGAIKMGTESMAPFENIKISDCYIYETNNGGIKLLTVDGAHLRNVEISDITMVEVKTPILIRLGSRLNVFRKGKDTKQVTGTLDNVVIRNVKAQAAANAQLMPPSGILITGVPGHYITNLRLENIEIDLAGGGTKENARQVVPEAIDKYPEVKTFGPLVPAYGVWARHVKGLKLVNIKFNLANNDLRPAFICDDGNDIEITGWKIPETSGAESILRLENVDAALISNMDVKGVAEAFVRVEGTNSKAIRVLNNKTPGIENVLTLSADVKPEAVLHSVSSTKVAPLWNDFVDAKKTGKTPVLPDYSYAGYQFSEKPIPDVSGKKFYSVVDFGAIPNDNKSDEDGIQAAIDAAQKNANGGVVFFPRGKYLLVADTNNKKQIRITKSNIVLKGSGSGAGGTEIHQANMWVNNRQIIFRPAENKTELLTSIIKDAPRESFWVEVNDPSKLRVGQDVVMKHKSEEYTRLYLAPLELKTQWTRLFGEKGGMQISEIHTVEKIQGNKVKFKNPLHLDVKIVKSAPFELYTYNSIEECGVEDILFTSNWKTYPEEFVHHKNAIHDNAYIAIGMENAKNSWVRNCEFHDWNDGVFFRAGYQVSVLNVIFKGKKGHTSVHARSGYGVLIKNCHFNGAQHHGPGTGYGASGTVITQCSMNTDQNFDIHSGQPYATLFDDIMGGIFSNLGGPEPGHPHHGRQLVLWNFRQSSTKDMHYNFWDMERRRNYTIAQPILVGFQSDKKVDFENTGYNQLQNEMVLPVSLFEAQLALRLTGKNLATELKKGF